MKTSFLIIIILLLTTSCTFIGKAIDKKASKNSGNPNDRSLENAGFVNDLKVIEAIINYEKKEKDVVKPIACKEEGSHQVCTAIKGCWCEKT